MLPGDARRWLSRVLVTALLIVVSGLLGWAALSQDVSYVVTNGVSMRPLYSDGDLVVTAKADTYRVGQIVAYHDIPAHLVLMHRIVGGDATKGFDLKGDSNDSTDVFHPTNSQIIGRAAVHIPSGGIWLRRATSPPVVGFLTFFLLTGGGTAWHVRHRRRRAMASRHAGPGHGPGGSVTQWSPGVQTSAGVIATVGLLGIALGIVAWTSPATHRTTSARPSGSSMTFGYDTTVARTPAYDSTIVRAPDPVFRSLAKVVAVHFAYRGAPGRVVVVANLSTAGGWHSTVPLAGSTPVTKGHYRGVVRLDLNALDRRAKSAAAVTHIPYGEILVAVVPRVTTADGRVFAPALRMSLTPLQLAPADKGGSLKVTDSATTKHSVEAASTWRLANHAVSVTAARALSLLLIVGALLVGLALPAVSRLLAPANETARIMRRYRHLLVAASPVHPDVGHTVVDVTDVATLARLAERYGALIVHWSEQDGETFLLEDQGTAYRYRSDATSPTRSPIRHRRPAPPVPSRPEVAAVLAMPQPTAPPAVTPPTAEPPAQSPAPSPSPAPDRPHAPAGRPAPAPAPAPRPAVQQPLLAHAAVSVLPGIKLDHFAERRADRRRRCARTDL